MPVNDKRVVITKTPARSTLALESLEIQGFKAFSSLSIPSLGRVNLIVGRNNVGKTCILEALQLYAARGSSEVFYNLLYARDELFREDDSDVDADPVSVISCLFNGRTDPTRSATHFRIGPIGAQESAVTCTADWWVEEVDDQDEPVLKKVAAAKAGSVESAILRISAASRGVVRRTTINSRFARGGQMIAPQQFTMRCFVIPANGLARSQIGAMWDRVQITDEGDEVIDALKIVAPGIDRLSVVVAGTDGNLPSRVPRRVPMVRMIDSTTPFPLKSLGDGTYRAFGLALALVAARNGLLLVDEFDTGLHFSVIPNIWKFIVKAAKRLNVQVFATTHSWDCISGFASAAVERDGADSTVIRLGHLGDEVFATTFKGRELQSLTKDNIEVR